MPLQVPKKGASKAQKDAINAKRERREAAKGQPGKAELKKADAPAPESSPAESSTPAPEKKRPTPVFNALRVRIQEKRLKNRGLAPTPEPAPEA